MTLLDELASLDAWQSFLQYKKTLAVPTPFEKDLEEFISGKDYLSVYERIMCGERFSLPERAVISKMYNQKKRVVYTYPPAENMVLKLLTYLLLRKYDSIFSEGLYSFRPGRTAKDAVRRLSSTRGIRDMYSYKADISNYFNSVNVEKLLPMLEKVLGGDTALYSFLSALLTEEHVSDRGEIITEKKGIMAGTPLSSFYANLYLSELDSLFCERNIPYSRYSDDIILFAPSREEAEEYACQVRDFIAGKDLSINPDKEVFRGPDEGWTFLGFCCKGSKVDIAPASVMKLKQKMRRKSRALQRWRKRNGLSGEKAAAAFIRVFNRKLMEASEDSDLTWSFWFFSVINTAETLREIDRYAQDCIRYLISGSRSKSRYNVRYEDMKKLGYRSLVNSYYSFTDTAADK